MAFECLKDLNSIPLLPFCLGDEKKTVERRQLFFSLFLFLSWVRKFEGKFTKCSLGGRELCFTYKDEDAFGAIILVFTFKLVMIPHTHNNIIPPNTSFHSSLSPSAFCFCDFLSFHTPKERSWWIWCLNVFFNNGFLWVIFGICFLLLRLKKPKRIGVRKVGWVY